ncbi:MATE family efflux transporter [Halobacteriovorax sp. GB3]|uniref:MATE family efflux transporter n=1 Tax=Halobacteriovorax sp. GB3 TaxID=2719615 RepID=UPI002361B905|nr:MATE family efflux transporter [Halobacteriovorax sp. GB3]MDD0853552.1 MATE family efflux transporter [Halobacteriovorax sp. GB3]
MNQIKENEGLDLKALFLFSLPSIFASMLEPLSGVVDTALVGKLSTEWLGAMGIGLIIMSSFTWMFNFLVHASTQSVSSAFGQENEQKVVSKIKISLILSFTLGLGSALFLYFIRVPLYPFAGATEKIIPFVDEYFLIRLIGHPFTLLYTTALSLLRGLGRVKDGFYIVGLTTLTNIVVSWLLLYPFDLGLKGAAIGTVLANIMGFAICLFLLFRVKFIREHFLRVRAEREGWLSFGKNSFNLFVRSFCLTSSFFICTKIAGSLGVESLAAHQILLQAWLFSSFFIDGVAITANVKGANYMAKKDFRSFNILSMRLLHMGGLIGLCFSIIYFFFDSSIQALFTNDPLVIKELIKIWPLIALSQFIASVAYVYDGILFGLGAFMFIRKHMLIGVFLVFLPLICIIFLFNHLIVVWIALCGLLLYRGASGYVKTREVVGAHYGKFGL